MKYVLAIKTRLADPELCEFIESKCNGDVIITNDAIFPSKSRFLTHVKLLLTELCFARCLAKYILTHNEDIYLLLFGHHIGGLLTTRLANLVRRRPIHIYIGNFYLHEIAQNRLVMLVIRFLLGQRIGILVQSEADRRMFANLSGNLWIDYYPYCMDKLACVSHTDVKLGDYVFAGGYSNRDYSTLLSAASMMPQYNFLIACSSANNLGRKIPENVEVRLDLSSAKFHRLMAESSLVIIPLRREGGAAGQMVALAAMQIGKCVIYANHDSVSQYFDPHIDGIPYEIEDNVDLCRNISMVLSNRDLLLGIGTHAKEKWYKKYRRSQFNDVLIKSFLKYRDVVVMPAMPRENPR